MAFLRGVETRKGRTYALTTLSCVVTQVRARVLDATTLDPRVYDALRQHDSPEIDRFLGLPLKKQIAVQRLHRTLLSPP